MGAVADVRAIFEALLAEIYEDDTTYSEQWHLANLFGDQEYARTLLEQNPDLPPNSSVDIPSVKPGQKTEYHIGLGYESALFQSVGYSSRFMSWLWFDRSKGEGKALEGVPPDTPHGFELPEDLVASPPPFSAEKQSRWIVDNGDNCIEVKNATAQLPLHLSWRDLPLATNLVTKQVSAILHFSSERKLRDWWWDKMWFYAFGRQLLETSARVPRAPLMDTPVDGRTWWNSGPSHQAKAARSQSLPKAIMGEHGVTKASGWHGMEFADLTRMRSLVLNADTIDQQFCRGNVPHPVKAIWKYSS